VKRKPRPPVLEARDPRDEDSTTVPLSPVDEPTRFDPNFPRLTLHATRGPLRGTIFRMNGVVFNLGREPGADVVVPGGGVSRRHAQIHLRAGHFFVSDQGTVNGTRVNGTAIAQALRLEAGDRIGIGRTELAVTFGDDPVPPRRRPEAKLDALWRSHWPLVGAGVAGAALTGFLVCVANVRKPVPPPAPLVPAAPPRVVERRAPPAPPPEPPKLALPTAPALLRARNLHVITSDNEGVIRELLPVGSPVLAQQKLLEYQASASELARKRAHLKAMQQKYGGRPEYADFIDEARAEVAQAGAPHALRSPVTGVIIDEKVSAGDRIKRGLEVAHVATDVEVLLDAGVVQGAGATCKVFLWGGTTLEGRANAPKPGDEQRTVALTTFPSELSLGELGAARAECR
jgi:pSer/pThr/pTyr-binding forkhead associated (FHA) protein